MLNGGADIASVPMQIQYDPAKLSLVNVDTGDLLGKDGQAVALVHRDDGPGNITINASRPPGTAGVSGAGVVCVLSFQAKAAGESVIAITQPGSGQQRTAAVAGPGRAAQRASEVRSSTDERTTANPKAPRTRAGTDAGRVDRDRGDSGHPRLGGGAHRAVQGEARKGTRTAPRPVEMRDAIDQYKDAADSGAFQTKVDSQNYPPDLETLVNGVDVQGKKVKFLRRIPVDPMTGKAEWGLRSMQDDPKSDSYGGQSVFDVYSKSTGTALDGTKYSEW